MELNPSSATSYDALAESWIPSRVLKQLNLHVHSDLPDYEAYHKSVWNEHLLCNFLV